MGDGDARPARKRGPRRSEGGGAVTLRHVAERVGLSPATVSMVLNQAPTAASIPSETQERIFAAVRELNYRPNYLARSLRSRRTYSVGVLVPEISEPYAAEVMSGIEGHLLEARYHYLVASHRRSNADLLHEYIDLMRDRAVEGLIVMRRADDRIAMGLLSEQRQQLTDLSARDTGRNGTEFPPRRLRR